MIPRMLHLTVPARKQGQFLRTYWRHASGFWGAESRRLAWSLTVGLVLIVLLQLAGQYRSNIWSPDFFDSLVRGEGQPFWHKASLSLPLAAASTVLMLLV